MSKHIKGPWRWDGNPCSYDASNEAPWLVSAANEADVILKGQIECTSEEAARLIEAAPELLEAARLVIAWYEAECDPSKTDFYQRMQMCRDSEDALRAAIAKATGEKQ